MQDVDLPQQDVAEAILEACHAIGSSTAILMQVQVFIEISLKFLKSATSVQQEFNKLATSSENKSFYKRDPAWTEGLISASR